MKTLLPVFYLLVAATALPAQQPADFERDVVPLLNRYCVGCHAGDDAEAGLVLTSFSQLLEGGEHGPPIDRAKPEQSLLLARISGTIEPMMPPQDEPQPSQAEKATLVRWLQAGAPGPTRELERQDPITPRLPASEGAKPVTALAYSPQATAVGRFGRVELFHPSTRQLISDFATCGKVNDLSFAEDDRLLVAATGVTGVRGEAVLWDVVARAVVRTFQGHADTMYAVALSPDNKLLATASYDREIILWDTQTGERVRTLSGHNGAVYDVDFSPDGTILASASADATVKVWKVESGERLDTLGQPLKEQYSVDISPDGRYLIAGGQDNRIRMWALVSREEPKINPLRYARFAHEGAIQNVRYSRDGAFVVSSSEDHTVKLWSADGLEQLDFARTGAETTQAFGLLVDDHQVGLGGVDGTIEVVRLRSTPTVAQESVVPPVTDSSEPTGAVSELTEQEPNDRLADAPIVVLPATIRGRIFTHGDAPDQDVIGFQARAGETWICEVNAAQSGSGLDSHVAIVHADGTAVARVQLQAVRDSYFTFRGKDSDTTGDFRLHNWEEMQLNQLLYAGGEVVKLYHYPRGPDSGFNVYPNYGRRRGYFDTTPLAHALHEPCYIVEAHAPNAQVAENGLPVFVISYENDDDSQRRLGKDSRLTFVAPQDGTYYAVIRDVRGLEGEGFSYQFSLRAPQPDFRGKVLNTDVRVAPGSGRKFGVEIERIDGFDGPIDLHVKGLPSGFSVPGPWQVEPDHDRAWATLQAADDVEAPVAGADVEPVEVVAQAHIRGSLVERTLGSLGKIELEEEPKLLVRLMPDHKPTAGDAILPAIEVLPGTTTTATIRITRIGHDGRVEFGNEDGAINAPHGVYVDNIGLNGVLIVEGQLERQIFISAEPWVAPQERIIFVEAGESGKPTSNPVILRVLPAVHPIVVSQESAQLGATGRKAAEARRLP